MLLAKKIYYKPDYAELRILNSMAFSANKLWNIANYEKNYFQELEFDKFPDDTDQKKRLKENFWYLNLPSQTAQDVINRLHKGWKSYFKVKENPDVENPRPPKIKKKGKLFNFTYLNNGFRIIDNMTIRLSVSRKQKEYMRQRYAIDNNYIYLKTEEFSKIDGKIKTIEFIPVDKDPAKNKAYHICISYEIDEPAYKEDNGHHLSIDLGLKNLFTCYDNEGSSFIISNGRYLEITHYFQKEIARYKSIYDKQQKAEEVKYPKLSKRVKKMYEKMDRQIEHFYHTATKDIVDYCKEHDITKVVIGDWTNIRKTFESNDSSNQQFHAFPFKKIVDKLRYKLTLSNIELIIISEAYSSQTSPFAERVDKEHAAKKKRVARGNYIDEGILFNADSVGAYNIMRLYYQYSDIKKDIPIKGLSDPKKYHTKVSVKPVTYR